MNVLMVHYHLRRGGVTTVIRRQLSALASRGIGASVLTGEYAPDFETPVVVDTALGYDGDGSGFAQKIENARIRTIVDAIGREADSLGEETVIHVHNPTIRKNSSLLAALAVLAASGRPLLMQVHDLAEDWRPDVYAPDPYPEGTRWAAINRFDTNAIAKAGAGTTAFLTNPVPLDTSSAIPSRPAGPRRKPGPGLFLYPVRGIRRKNLGEAILLSLFMRKGSSIGITLPPNSPQDLPFYENWQAMAARLEAPVAFGLGLEQAFDGLYAEARAIITTSIKEGFGLSFLEPISRGRATLGRRLDRVVSDFEQTGLEFPGLYPRLAVPTGLFDEENFTRRVEKTVRMALASYGLYKSTGEEGKVRAMVQSIVASVLGSAEVLPDFGRLDEEAQSEVLLALGTGAEDRRRFIAANPFIEAWDAAADTIFPPSTARLAPWSQSACGERLEAAYAELLENGGGPAPDKQKLLDLYLTPGAYHGVGI